jgi:selenide,water dikinase
LPGHEDPNLLVGFETHDDAGIYRLHDDLAIITTADFITPPVNDPFVFGQIAAANAISDVYAMGGRPVICLNLAGFPSKKLGPEILNQIVAGGLSKITEAGAVLAGGHTTDDDEPKYGLAVTGVVHPDRYWTNTGAQPGDDLILTKPIGSGVLFNANIKGWVSSEALDECLKIITKLNKSAAQILQNFDVHAATDVTGFGLAGHGYEMAVGSGVRLNIRIDDVPVMAQALEMYARGVSTGVNPSNRKLVNTSMRFEKTMPGHQSEIVFDPQTSGGLLVAVPAGQSRQAVKALHKADVGHACVIGSVDHYSDGLRLLFK